MTQPDRRPSPSPLLRLVGVTLLVCLASTPAIATEPLATDAPVLPLADVLERARSSILVEIAAHDIDVARVREREAWAERWPRIRANFTVSPAPRVVLGDDEPTEVNTSDRELLRSVFGDGGLSLRGELDATVPITTFGKIRLARQLADAGIDAAEAQRDAAVAESQFEAYRAYVVLQAYDASRGLLVEAAERLDRAELLLEDAIDDGDLTARTSLRQLTIARTDFVALRTGAEQAGASARYALVRGLDLPLGFVAEPLDETLPTATPPTLDRVLEVAAEHRTDLQLLEIAMRAAELERRLRFRRLAPDAFFAAQVAGAWSPTVEDVSDPYISDPWNRFGFGFLVGLNWSMNPMAITQRAMRAAAQEAGAEARYEGAKAAVDLDVAEAYNAAIAARELLLSYDDSLRAARAWLNQRWFQFDQGLADYDDIKDPLQTYYRTAGRYYETLTAYRIAVAQLALACGVDHFDRWPGTAE